MVSPLPGCRGSTLDGPQDPMYRPARRDGPWVPNHFDDMRFQQARASMCYEPGWHVVVGCARATASIGGSDEDDVSAFVANLPLELKSKPFVHVKGKISSAPLDLPDRAQKFRDAIKAKGWTWFERGFDTNVSTFLGIPLPGGHDVEGMMFPADGHTPAAGEGQGAVDATMKTLNLDYSAIGEWVHEVNENIVKPSLNDAGKLAKKITPVNVGLVLGGLALVYVMMR